MRTNLAWVVGALCCLWLVGCGSDPDGGSDGGIDGAVQGNGCSGYLGASQPNCAIGVSCANGKLELGCAMGSTSGMCQCMKYGVAGQTIAYDATYCTDWATDKKAVMIKVGAACGWGCREQSGFLVCDP